jgi:signal transduction histidine kinase
VVITTAAATRIDSPTAFLIVMPLTSGLFTVPTIALSAINSRRVVGPLRPFWRWYFLGNAVFYVVGTGIVNYGISPMTAHIVVTMVALAVAVVFDALAIDQVVRARSGARSRSVDLVESFLAIVMVTAPLVVINGDDIRTSPFAWFAVVTVVCLMLFVAGLWCGVVLFVRSPRGTRQATGVGIALGVGALIDAVVQVEHVVSGFALPHPIVLGLNGLCMSFLLLLPLHARQGHARGLVERLPPQAQIRTGTVVAVVTFAALPALGAAVLVAGATPTAVHVAGAALALLVALSAVRQLLTYSETRRLYAEVERSAEERRALLAAVLESMDAERRRVAMQLHEQASSSYAALAQLVPTDELSGRANGAERVAGEWGARLRPVPTRPLSHLLTERMAAQAESLRELVGAIRPGARTQEAGLAPILRAQVDSVDDADRPPVTHVEVADDLRLDWITETIALRVVQEAVRNTCRHAEAENLSIVLDIEDDIAVVRVSDDGVGFDVDGLVVESGIATMRRFVSFCGGELRIRSQPAGGTLVEARLGGPPPELPRRPRLRPV